MDSRMSALALALVAGACSEPGPTVTIPVYDVTSAMSVTANGVTNDGVPLSGDEEVPARPTRARGAAVLHFDDETDELHYQLIVANIENVVQAHIHVNGAVGVNGPVGVFLYGPVAAGGGRIQGVIGEGTLTGANFVGPLTGLTMDDLKNQILAGTAYVNVHTNNGVAPTNEGPGDFPGGEVRGQIQ